VFLYEPLGLTFAEIPLAVKNTISHRGRAMQAFKHAVENEGILK
jgi:XTP/dITP diphosphohydrolase